MHYQSYSNETMRDIPQFKKLPLAKQEELELLSRIFRFKTNNYVVNELIDWDSFDEDPVFALNFPRKEMIDEYEFTLMLQLIKKRAADEIIDGYIKKIKLRLLPPRPPKATNLVHLYEPKGIAGLYHKFPQTLGAFPLGAKSCHAYCAYCYRWMSFAFDDIQFHYSDPLAPVDYLTSHPEVSDILFTGGDALHMSAEDLKKFISPLLDIESLHTIRLGTRTLTWWPYRFVTDADADELLAFLEFIVSKGKHVTFMSHISHARELRTEVVRQALQRIRSTGAVIRSQCPIIKGLNDSKEAWIELLRREIYLGIVPYYMFIESSETLNQAFKIPLASALRIHQDAQFALSGLAKTLSGPVISNGPYKILIDGTAEITGEKVFVLKFLQSTDTDQKGSIFFAKYDETATDLEQLQAPGGGDNIVESFSRRSTFGLQD